MNGCPTIDIFQKLEVRCTSDSKVGCKNMRIWSLAICQQWAVRAQLRRLRQSSTSVKVARRRHRRSHRTNWLGLLFLLCLQLCYFTSGEVSWLGLSSFLVEVPKEEYTASLLPSCLLDELAGALILPERGPEIRLYIYLIMLSHDLFNITRGFTGVVE
jgi:hypothetical protein